jgi:hypothetical protein
MDMRPQLAAGSNKKVPVSVRQVIICLALLYLSR